MTFKSPKYAYLAGCIISDDSGNILLMHRSTPKRSQWELPGGKIELGEKPEEAARRELEEELGVKVALKRRIGECTFQEDEISFHYVWFLAQIQSGIPSLREVNFDRFAYTSWNDIESGSLKLSSNIRNLLKAYKTHPGLFI